MASARRLEPGSVRRVAIVASRKVGMEHLERLQGALVRGGVKVVETRPEDDPDGRDQVDLVFVLGGDGTMLRASRIYPGKVLLGVNFGRVGFMAGMLPEHLEEGVQKVLSAGIEVQEYRKLDVRVGDCLLYTSPSPRDRTRSRMPSSA